MGRECRAYLPTRNLPAWAGRKGWAGAYGAALPGGSLRGAVFAAHGRRSPGLWGSLPLNAPLSTGTRAAVTVAFCAGMPSGTAVAGPQDKDLGYGEKDCRLH
jgi:hypothetical protein